MPQGNPQWSSYKIKEAAQKKSKLNGIKWEKGDTADYESKFKKGS